jgi:hypothetical protein
VGILGRPEQGVASGEGGAQGPRHAFVSQRCEGQVKMGLNPRYCMMMVGGGQVPHRAFVGQEALGKAR